MRVAIMLHDGPLPSHGLKRFAHRPEVGRLAEVQLYERATAKVNALIQAPTPYNRTQTNDDHDNGECNTELGFSEKISG